MVWSVAFDPLVPLWELAAAGAIAILLVAVTAFLALRGWVLRAAAMGLVVLALANPAIERGKPRATQQCCRVGR